MEFSLGGLLFWALTGGTLFLIRPGSSLHKIPVTALSRKQILALACLVLALIVLTAFLMTLSPIWNGMMPRHRNAYELMTEFMLQGHIDYIGETDPAFLELENPYDPEARMAAGADVPWDWSYYKGHFYMYFGVVPILLVFMPYRLLTGHAPATLHATRLFTGLFILGLAAFFLRLSRNRFRKMTLGQLACLLTAFSLVSTVYVSKFPALYQTAVSCGMFLEIWSLYFFSRAVWEERTEKSAIRLAFLGSVCGALTFGCRPPLALANLLVIPLLIHFLRGRRMTAGLAGRLLLAASPYIVTAAALMTYNYVRFENPFEFGQTYQLTVVDQTKTPGLLDPGNLFRALAGNFNNLFAAPKADAAFPFLNVGTGAVTCCPLLLYAFSCLRKKTGAELRKQDLYTFSLTLAVSVLLISTVQVIGAQVIWERYKSDYLWLLSVGAFIAIGTITEAGEDARAASRKTCLAAFFCVLLTALVFLVPDDLSYTDYFPGALAEICRTITFGLAG